MKTCPFCKNSIAQSSEKCPLCQMTLIEKVPVLKKTVLNSSPKQTPPTQKTYQYTPPPKSVPLTSKNKPLTFLKIPWFVWSIIAGLVLLMISHQSPSDSVTQSTSAESTSSIQPVDFQPTAPIVDNLKPLQLQPVQTIPDTPSVSLPTGTVLYKNPIFFNDYNGEGELTIQNGSGYDAVVKLVYNDHSEYTVYVQKNDTYSIKDITDGTYTVAFAFGVNWDKTNNVFLEDQSFQKFDDPFDFTTTSDTDDYIYSHYTITLNPVVGGTATTSNVNQSDFNSY